MLKGKGIITNLQREILKLFSTLSDSQFFYLTGGTALSEFYLAHRKSYDLDLFSVERGIILPFSRVLEDELKKRFRVNVIRRLESLVEMEVQGFNEATRIQLAIDSPARFEDPVDSDIGIKINDYKDLIVDKLLAFYGRAEARDAVDLFFILQREGFQKLVELAKQKDPGFDLYWFAIALERVKGLPDEIERWPVDMLIRLNAKEIKALFTGIIYQIMEEIKLKGPKS